MTDPADWDERLRQALEPLGVNTFLADPSSGFWCDKVSGLTVGAGVVTAQVRATRTRGHQTRIAVPVHGKPAWAALTQALATDSRLATALLTGEVPLTVEPACADTGHPLLPDFTQEAALDCTCPAPATPCGHLHATLAVLARAVRADPFRLFALRGRDRDTLLTELRSRLGVTGPQPAKAAAPPLTAVLDDFFDWPTPDGAAPAPTRGDQPGPVLDELPPLTTTVAGVGLTDLLRPLYQALTSQD
ncbi:SWIM zinc finger family protein [Crossiella sp. CA198]|uniref:SWIM zinc finger family protein n=1 Tax=Crossiella sp. CA198 TaxID=3455607 RepID=UPI003F8D4A73